jgi:predicted CopG family antitoxin
MQKKLTITVDEQVYQGLYQVIGRHHISQFIAELVRPHVVRVDLNEAYRQMAAEELRELEAEEWTEATLVDIADETR